MYMHKCKHKITHTSHLLVHSICSSVSTQLPKQTCLRDKLDSLSVAKAWSSLWSWPLNCSISASSEVWGAVIRLISSSDCTSASRASTCMTKTTTTYSTVQQMTMMRGWNWHLHVSSTSKNKFITQESCIWKWPTLPHLPRHCDCYYIHCTSEIPLAVPL